MKKTALLTVVCHLMLGLFLSAGEGSEKSIPDITLTNLQGEKISLMSLKGNIIIVNFWATWCPPCITEIPDFIEAYRQYRDKGLVIIGISLDEGGTSVVKRFAAANSINYPVVMMNRQIYQSFDIGKFIPVTFVFDRQGKLVQKKVGPMSKKDIDGIFQTL